MPRWTTLVAGWALAALCAVVLSWSAVAQVRNRVIQPSTPIPAATLGAQDRAEPGTTTAAVIPLELEPATTTPLPSSDQTSTSQPREAAVTTTTVQTPSSSAASATPTSTTTPASTTAPSPATTTIAPPPSTTTTAPVVTQTTAYQLVGGTVTISYSPGVVTFVSAIPQPGFSTEIEESGPNRVRVHFESEDHDSEFRAEWDGAELDVSKSEHGEN